MQTKSFTPARVAHRIDHTDAYTAQHPTEIPQQPSQPLQPAQPALRTLREEALHILRNPLFLVIVTWLVMAGLLVLEIAGGR